MDMIRMSDIEKIAEEEINKYPYPKYIGNGLYRIAHNCICSERMMEKINENK